MNIVRAGSRRFSLRFSWIGSMVLFLTLCVPLSAAEWSKALTRAKLHLRAERNTESKTLSMIPAASVVYVKDCNGTWCRALWHRDEGYIVQAYLTPVRQ